MSDKILLKDIFQFDELLKKYNSVEKLKKNHKKIKLRFNTNWKEKTTKFNFVDMYVNKIPDFEPYILSIGSPKKARNDVRDIQFQFIEVEQHKWLFVGAYVILDTSSLSHTNMYGVSYNYASASRLIEYDKFVDRILVEWTNKPQQFFYVGKEIVDSVELTEIYPKPYFEKDSEFPGYEHLSKSYDDLKIHLNNKSWRDQLSSVYGVYIITDKKKGKLYIGSAYGIDGVYGRWSAYLKDGYDKDELEDSKYPNIKLKNLVNDEGIEYIQKHFQYTLLEIFSKTELGKKQALEREKYWKEVFKSKEHGYNGN
ncbi:MAG: GIY-YIG nuclease family protein [Massilibacteroides sp.]|jgi:hypothetical protein|nr:GIY-YIG nuclease family protein [Massilibacteroides sp.]